MGLKARWNRWVSSLETKSPRLHRFLSTSDSPYPMLREASAFGLILLLGATILWGSMGQPLGDSPVVVVESGSMMHCANGVGPEGSACKTERYGRIATIDPGDLIFVKDIDRHSDVETLAENGENHYGKSGDVIIYIPDGSKTRTPIIHRALFWLEINEDNTFTVEELGLYNLPTTDHVYLQALGLKEGYHNDLRSMGAGPDDSGFITRGDNNRDADQDPHSNIARMPVKAEWVLGVARGEVPWLGLVKLKFSDWVVGTDNYDRAPSDSKSMLLITLALLLGGPYILERVLRARKKRKIEEMALPSGPRE